MALPPLSKDRDGSVFAASTFPVDRLQHESLDEKTRIENFEAIEQKINKLRQVFEEQVQRSGWSRGSTSLDEAEKNYKAALILKDPHVLARTAAGSPDGLLDAAVRNPAFVATGPVVAFGIIAADRLSPSLPKVQDASAAKTALEALPASKLVEALKDNPTPAEARLLNEILTKRIAKELK